MFAFVLLAGKRPGRCDLAVPNREQRAHQRLEEGTPSVDLS